MAKRLTMQEVIEHCDKTTRLMERVFTCIHDGGEFGQIESKGYLEHKQTSEWLRELQKSKELEEHGRLVELPCVPNETVWCADEYNTRPVLYGSKSSILYDIECVKGIGYTKEEAEEKLKELRGEQE